LGNAAGSSTSQSAGCYHASYYFLRCLASSSFCGGTRFIFGARLLADSQDLLMEGLLSALTPAPTATATTTRVCAAAPYRALVQAVFHSLQDAMVAAQRERLKVFLGPDPRGQQ
jgi:hypothetical protein